MFKLLTICGTVLKANQRSSTRITWIEQARSTELKAPEKIQLLKAMNDNSKSIWEDPNLMAIGIEFRLNTGCEKTD